MAQPDREPFLSQQAEDAVQSFVVALENLVRLIEGIDLKLSDLDDKLNQYLKVLASFVGNLPTDDPPAD